VGYYFTSVRIATGDSFQLLYCTVPRCPESANLTKREFAPSTAPVSETEIGVDGAGVTLPAASMISTRTVNGVFTTPVDDGWHSGWGWQAGGGLELGWGITNLFVESRYSRFSGEFSKISHVPLVIGLSWY